MFMLMQIYFQCYIFVITYTAAQKAAAKKSCKTANYAWVKKYNYQHDLQSGV